MLGQVAKDVNQRVFVGRSLDDFGARTMFEARKARPNTADAILGGPQPHFLRTSRKYSQVNIENHDPVFIVRFVGKQIDQTPVMSRIRSRYAILPLARGSASVTTTGG